VIVLKVVAKPIEMIALFDNNGTVNPTKFRIIQDEETTIVIIDKVISQSKERLAGIYKL